MKKNCWLCGGDFEMEIADTWIDYRGSNYDTRLVKCKCCGAVIIVEYLELPNRDDWKMKGKE